MTAESFPPSLTMKQSTGFVAFLHPCGICGGPASVGTGVRLLKYFRQKAAGESPDKRLLGRWRCWGCEDVK